jgi:hypothetical protein
LIGSAGKEQAKGRRRAGEGRVIPVLNATD